MREMRRNGASFLETTISGIKVRARKRDGWIFWTSAWERIYELVKSGHATMTYTKYNYGHCSFYLSNIKEVS